MENQLIKYVGTHSEYTPAEVVETLLPMNKTDVIVFLAWDEPNGLYLDLQRSNAGLKPLSECECKLMAMATLWDNSAVKDAPAKLNDLIQRANDIIESMVNRHNGEYREFSASDVFKNGALTNDFVNKGLLLFIDTAYTENDDVRFLSIWRNDKDIWINCIDEYGSTEEHLIEQLSDSTLIALADWLKYK